MKQFLSILFCSTILFFSGSIKAEEVPSSGEMLIDVVIARPLGLASLAVGSGLFIISSPFALMSGEAKQSLKETGNRLVLYPFKYTFIRKVGKFPGFMEEYEVVTD
ncbi:MAG: hypothetical protein H7A25_20765 [Leptospiraceae bacterium]|nr:hypothetical protein [Leptospiraceae bacterium]MCP5502341.1 hypothetical protein [Leptospiraceae bacterium]